jgi:5-formyltetrahydrofolate cyclo-ligase
VAIPVVRQGSRVLRHAEIQGLDLLEPDGWGIPGPLPDHADWIEDLGALDLVVVPGIAFDRQGRRLGFGGGYYDRFLSLTQAPKIGLSYDCTLLDEVPVEPHDARVDIVITESSTLRVGAH